MTDNDVTAEDRENFFRQRLVSLLQGLQADAADGELRAMVGGLATSLFTESKTHGWADLKQRADGKSYDSLLALFQKQAQELAKAGNTKGVRAVEILGLSLIARRQYADNLQTGIQLLDQYIEDAVSAYIRATTKAPPQTH